jgi:hypothetical protein
MCAAAAYAVHYTVETTIIPAYRNAHIVLYAAGEIRSSEMADYFPPSGQPQMQLVARTQPAGENPGQQLADLKIFWGPEICRLEYLVHLLDTGRIKDDYWRETA